MGLANRRGTIHVDGPLTNLSIAYGQGSLIADRVAPRVSVSKESDLYYVFARTERNISTDLKADKAKGNKIDTFSTSTEPYVCQEHEMYDLISDRERQNADVAIQPDMAVTNGLTAAILLGREKRVADLFMSTGTWENELQLAGVDQFNNAAYDSDSETGSIEARLDAGKEAVRIEIGQDANVAIIPEAVAKVIKRDSAIRELRKYTEPNLVKGGDLPSTMFDLQILRPGGVYNTAKKGQTQAMADLWGKHIWIGYINPVSMGLRTMTAMLTMESRARRVRRWREETEGQTNDAIEVSEVLVEKVVSSFCGYWLEDCIA